MPTTSMIMMMVCMSVFVVKQVAFEGEEEKTCETEVEREGELKMEGILPRPHFDEAIEIHHSTAYLSLRIDSGIHARLCTMTLTLPLLWPTGHPEGGLCPAVFSPWLTLFQPGHVRFHRVAIRGRHPPQHREREICEERKPKPLPTGQGNGRGIRGPVPEV